MNSNSTIEIPAGKGYAEASSFNHMTTETSSVPAAAGEDKTVAILSYLTLIGFIVAIVMHSSNKTSLGAFHLRQCLGLILASIAAAIGATIIAFIPFVGWIVAPCIWLGFFVLWVMGLLAAINGKKEPMPILGAQFQQWFSGAFN